MAKRGSRSVRIQILAGLYAQFQNGSLDESAVKSQVDYGRYVLYESEIDKVIELFPQFDKDNFVAFLKQFGAYKVPGSKTASGTAASRLNTAENAREKGVDEHSIQSYLAEIDAMYEHKKKAEEFLPEGRKIAISIPNRVEKSSGSGPEEQESAGPLLN